MLRPQTQVRRLPARKYLPLRRQNLEHGGDSSERKTIIVPKAVYDTMVTGVTTCVLAQCGSFVTGPPLCFAPRILFSSRAAGASRESSFPGKKQLCPWT